MTHPAISDLARRARRRLPRFVWEYLDSGTGDDTAAANNRAALDAVRLVPKPLGGNVAPVLETRLMGESYSLPVGFAPVGMSGLIWPGAEVTLAQVAVKARVPYCLSTVAAATPEEVGPHTGGKGWFQLYAPGDAEIRADMLTRAWDSGFNTLILTADVPVASRRERLRRAGITNPMKITPKIFLDCALHPEWSLTRLPCGIPRLVTLEKYADTGTSRSGTEHIGYLIRTAPDAEYLKALRDLWPGKLVVKGVLDPAAAKGMALLGADAIWVSNHAGRQFDAAPAAIDALPLVREAVGPEMPLIFDSGIASGTDILRAFALGADFTFVGRAPHYGLAAFGKRGVAHVLDILRASLEADMGQMGISRPGEARTRRAG